MLGLYFAWVILTIIFEEYFIPQKTSKLVVKLKTVITSVFCLWRWGPQGKGFNEETQHGPVRGPVFEKFLIKNY